MGLGCGVSTIKYILFIANLIFTLFGIAIMAIGIIRITQDDDAQWFYIVVIAIGAATFLMAFFGCCGAIRESQCLVYTYATCLMILLIIQVVVAVLILVNLNDLISKEEMQRHWENRSRETEFWDNIQSKYKCCGLNNVSDWGNNIPSSCCAESSSTCTASNAHAVGCSVIGITHDAVSGLGHILAYIGFGFAAAQLIGFIFSCILVNQIRNNRRRSGENY